MQLKIDINTNDTSAIFDPVGTALFALQKVSTLLMVDAGGFDAVLYDPNGNRIGTATFEFPEPDDDGE
jgi:hypothetical protein